jgi:hypothetical protein
LSPLDAQLERDQRGGGWSLATTGRPTTGVQLHLTPGAESLGLGCRLEDGNHPGALRSRRRSDKGGLDAV